MADPVALVYGDAYREAEYDFGATHPLQPIRVQLAVELMRMCGLLDAANVTRLDPRLATREELLAVHDRAYVDAVETLGGAGAVWPELESLAREHGFLQSDNPVFADMHLAAGLVAGGTTVAAEAVMEGRALHAFAPGRRAAPCPFLARRGLLYLQRPCRGHRRDVCSPRGTRGLRGRGCPSW